MQNWNDNEVEHYVFFLNFAEFKDSRCIYSYAKLVLNLLEFWFIISQFNTATSKVSQMYRCLSFMGLSDDSRMVAINLYRQHTPFILLSYL